MEEINLRSYAHIGDAVWELWVRERTIRVSNNVKVLHEKTTEHVNAGHQSMLLGEISEILTEEEQNISRRGQNQPVPVGRRHMQKEYRKATSFEVLMGYWYINNKPRLEEMLKKIEEIEKF